MGITPAEARQVARDHVVKTKAPPSGAKVRVSDFGELADGGYSVLVDVIQAKKPKVRHRVKMDSNGKVTSFVTR